MSKPKVTEWFNCRDQPPVHIGPYEVQLWDVNEYCWSTKKDWNSKFWSDYGVRIKGIDRPGYHKKDRWRGLTEPSK